MAFIYEINGQRVEFQKEPNDRDIDEAAASMSRPKPETAAQTFGRSAASAADSVLNTVTGTLDAAAYPLARAFGRNPAQATAETTSPKDVFGRAFGVSNTAGYQQAPLRQLGTAIGETFGESVVKPVSQATGLPAADVASMAGMLPIPAAQPAARAVVATGRGVAKAAQIPVDVAKGAAGRATGYIAEPGVAPKGYQVQSSRVPLTETYIPQQGMQMLRENPNMLPADLPAAMAPQPTSTLPKVPVALSGGEMPLAGQGARAFGERLGETYRNPVTAAVDLGSLAFSGLPIYSLGRMAMAGVQGMADRRLSKFGFESLTPEQRVRMEAGQNPFNGGQTPVAAPMAAPVAGPVVPTAAQFGGLRQQLPVQPVAPASRSKNKPTGVSEMLTNENSKIVNTTPFGKNDNLNYEYLTHKLSGNDKPFTGKYKVGNVEIEKTISDFGNSQSVLDLGYFPNGGYFKKNLNTRSPNIEYTLTKEIKGKEVIITTGVNPETKKIVYYDVTDVNNNKTLYKKSKTEFGDKQYYIDIVGEIENVLKGK